jgi:hypothetical protein
MGTIKCVAINACVAHALGMDDTTDLDLESLSNEVNVHLARRSAALIRPASTREELIAALQAMDPNGCHSDAACIADGVGPYDLASAWETLESFMSDERDTARADLVARANEFLRPIGHAISVDTPRAALCAALQACDPNGCHTDALAIAEDFDPYTLEGAWEALAEIVANDE